MVAIPVPQNRFDEACLIDRPHPIVARGVTGVPEFLIGYVKVFYSAN